MQVERMICDRTPNPKHVALLPQDVPHHRVEAQLRGELKSSEPRLTAHASLTLKTPSNGREFFVCSKSSWQSAYEVIEHERVV